jgi:predicted AAA+ superfamily ATPase
MVLPRYLSAPVEEDLAQKMVFVAGPRQVGKTTLARELLSRTEAGVYLNWDYRPDRKRIRAAEWPPGEALVVLDELHKWRPWKSWIKGEYDVNDSRLRFLITGSARLDIYRRGGDSLQGRYHHYRLHPLSCAELAAPGTATAPEPGQEPLIPHTSQDETVAAMMSYGVFPEPFLAASQRALRRWQRERIDRFFREDVRDLEAIRDLGSLELLADLLCDRVGGLVSLNSLREDLEVSHPTVSNWCTILERLYLSFRVLPFASRRIQSLKRMPKIYLWDPSMVEDEAARFENLVGLHLLKLCHFHQDHDGYQTELWFLRDRAGREVDFLVTVKRRPWFAVEVKLTDTRIHRPLQYYQQRLDIPWVYQLTRSGDHDFVRDGVRCLPAGRFLAALV